MGSLGVSSELSCIFCIFDKFSCTLSSLVEVSDSFSVTFVWRFRLLGDPDRSDCIFGSYILLLYSFMKLNGPVIGLLLPKAIDLCTLWPLIFDDPPLKRSFSRDKSSIFSASFFNFSLRLLIPNDKRLSSPWDGLVLMVLLSYFNISSRRIPNLSSSILS